MYMVPVQFPQVTNREDFLSTNSIYDDVTNDPINLSGTILANPSMPFTASAWTVTSGTTATSSSTPLTIPVPPIRDELLAVTLTVAPGLTILPGDPVKIADTATGTNQMLGYITGYNANAGTLVCQIGLSFQFEIRGDGGAGGYPGYGPAYDWGLPNDQGAILRAGLGTGVSIIDIGYFQILIPEATFKQVLDLPYNSQSNTVARTLMASLTITDSVNTRQLYIGRLPVLYGGVTT